MPLRGCLSRRATLRTSSLIAYCVSKLSPARFNDSHSPVSTTMKSEDIELDDTWMEDAIWSPGEAEIEEPIISHVNAAQTQATSLLPSQFTEFAFWMPSHDKNNPGGENGLGYNRFTFDGRRHMRQIYDTPADHILLLCARQCEKSTYLGNRALCYSCLVPEHRTLYVSPSATQSKVFSNDRIKNPIETSPVLKRFTTHMLSQNILEKQFVNRSKITMRYAFLNADRARGIPSWLLELDEFQDLLYDNVPVIEQGTSHAPKEYRRFIYAGTPKSLDNNIEYHWSNLSTMCEWVVPHDCTGGDGGRYWNILGEKNIGRKGLICAKCGGLIDPMTKDAKWAAQVAKKPPKVVFEGYRIPQLMVPWRAWDDILSDYARYPRDKFYNEVLGISYDSGMRPLTTHNLQAVCRDDLKMSDIEKYRPMSYNQPIFAGVDWGCHDDKTRVLTESGFKYFSELTHEDKVAQWDAATRELTYAYPLAITAKDWDEPLLHFTTKGALDLMVTHDHRMRVRGTPRDNWRTETAEETAGRGGGGVAFVGSVNWRGVEREMFTLPGLPVSSGYSGCAPITVAMDIWLEFLGYLIAEGGVCHDSNGKPNCLKMSQRVPIHQKTADRMRECLDAICPSYNEFPNAKTGDINWSIYGKQFWKWVVENVGDLCAEKRVPREFMQLSPRQLRILLGALIDGDGSRDTRPGCACGTYSSTSRGLCDDVQELCIKLGMRAVIRMRAAASGNRKTRWVVQWSTGRDYVLSVPRRRVERVPYKGKVYCCTVPTGYIVTERNGCVSYQGNSGEHAYTVICLATYIDMKLRVFYWHRFTGEETDPEKQLARICELIKFFNVRFIGSDYGGGFAMNHHLVRNFGVKRVHNYQYVARAARKLSFNTKYGRWMVARTEIMSDVFNAIKRHQLEFPRWEEFHEPYGQDMLNIFSEYNQTLRMTQYKHGMDRPDDSFHSLVYCVLASILYRPRPDIFVPRQEIKGQPISLYNGAEHNW